MRLTYLLISVIYRRLIRQRHKNRLFIHNSFYISVSKVSVYLWVSLGRVCFWVVKPLFYAMWQTRLVVCKILKKIEHTAKDIMGYFLFYMNGKLWLLILKKPSYVKKKVEYRFKIIISSLKQQNY